MASTIASSQPDSALDGTTHFDLPPAKCAAGLELAARLRVLDALIGRLHLEPQTPDGGQRERLYQSYADNRVQLDLLLDRIDPAHINPLRRHISAVVPRTAGTPTLADKEKIHKLIKLVCTLSTKEPTCKIGN